MEILRIPSSYRMQLEHLSDSDRAYIFMSLMRLSDGIDTEIENSLVGGITMSIWREASQLEKKAKKGKGEDCEIAMASFSLGVPLRVTPKGVPYDVPQNQTKPNQIKTSQTKSNQTESSDEDTQSVEVVKEGYGNSEINSMLAGLKKAVGCSDFKESQVSQRRYAKNFVTLKDKIGTEEFVKRLKGVLEDGFKAKNCNKLAFLYGEIKSFITDPQVVPVEAPKKQRFFDSADYVGE